MDSSATEKLTVYEWSGVTSHFNLADGHPRQMLVPAQIEAIGDVTKLFINSESRNELEVKTEFERAYFALAGQPSVHKLDLPLSQYSGSSAIELMANYLRMFHKTVTMMHPTFDSLADTLKRHNVPLKPMPVEEVLNLGPSSPPLGTDCLYFVAPNNPTGDCPTKEQFANIVEFCAKHKVMLLIDYCFRFFGDFWDYDQYRMMTDAGVEFITTEDTGKSFPAADVKLGMTISSPGPYPYLKDISDDFIFSVARFVFQIVGRFISAEDRDKKRLLSQDLADTNRKILHETLAGSNLQIVNPGHKMGLDWAKLPDGWNASHLCQWLYDNGGPQLLPGERFYWNDYDEGSHYVRLALLRNPDYFQAAMDSLRTLTDKYEPAPAPHAPKKSRAVRWSARAHK